MDNRRAATAWRIVVERGVKRVALFDGTRLVASSGAALGGGRMPTPLGTFFVTDVFEPPARSPYGAAAVAIAAHVAGSAGADHEAQLGIYGGTDIAAPTRGSVRVTNDFVRLLLKVPLGTPVEIRR